MSRQTRIVPSHVLSGLFGLPRPYRCRRNAVACDTHHLAYQARAELADFAVLDTPFGPVVGCAFWERVGETRIGTSIPNRWGDHETIREASLRRVPGLCHEGNPDMPARDDWRFTTEYVDRLWEDLFRYFDGFPDDMPFVQAVSPATIAGEQAGHYVECGNRRARWFTTLGEKRREWRAIRATGRAMGNPDTNPRA